MAHSPPGRPDRPARPGPGTSAQGTAPLTVGFDLDMTLIDTRPGIRAVYQRLSAETGVPIDADLAVSRLGPPLRHELAHWFPEDGIDAAVAHYRSLYPAIAIALSRPLPGAEDAFAAVRAAGGRAMVVTAKNEPQARMHLEYLDLLPDLLAGDLWAEAKGEALRAAGAAVYVGDHTGDVRGARTAGALSVTVPTGPCDEAVLRAAGADVVLTGGLPDFPGWLDGYRARAADRAETADRAADGGAAQG